VLQSYVWLLLPSSKRSIGERSQSLGLRLMANVCVVKYRLDRLDRRKISEVARLLIAIVYILATKPLHRAILKDSSLSGSSQECPLLRHLWRREWDSNPRSTFRCSTVFKTAAFVHSAIPPRGILQDILGGLFGMKYHGMEKRDGVS
jgi:hypothetical protein